MGFAFPGAGAVGGAARNAEAEAAAAAAQQAQRLKQIAEQSGVNKAAVMEAIKDVDPRQFGYATLKELKDFIFTARTRL